MGGKKLKMSRVAYEPLTISRIFFYWVCPLLSLTSLRLTLVPNQLFSGWSGMFLFLILGVAATAYHLGRLRPRPVDAEPSGLITLRFLTLAVFYGFLAWGLAGKWIPWAIAEAFGTPYVRETHVQIVHSISKRRCHNKLETPLMEGTYPNFICGDGKGFSFPGLVADVRLSGKQTFLGATVDKIELIRLGLDESRQRQQ